MPWDLMHSVSWAPGQTFVAVHRLQLLIPSPRRKLKMYPVDSTIPSAALNLAICSHGGITRVDNSD
jgi:hypothetical protein